MYYILLTYIGWRPDYFPLLLSPLSGTYQPLWHLCVSLETIRDGFTLQQHKAHEEYVQKPLCIKPLSWAVNKDTQHMAEFYNLIINLWIVLNKCCSSEIAHPIAHTPQMIKKLKNLNLSNKRHNIKGYKHF